MKAKLENNQRVRVQDAKGDRRRFEGRSGRIVKVQSRLKLKEPPFVHVRLDGASRSHVFLAHELINETAQLYLVRERR